MISRLVESNTYDCVPLPLIPRIVVDVAIPIYKLAMIACEAHEMMVENGMEGRLVVDHEPEQCKDEKDFIYPHNIGTLS